MLNAVAGPHTAGRPGMTQLDKILYLADMTSAERDWPGVESLRTLEMQDLDAAMLAALEQSTQFVNGRISRWTHCPRPLTRRSWPGAGAGRTAERRRLRTEQL